MTSFVLKIQSFCHIKCGKTILDPFLSDPGSIIVYACHSLTQWTTNLLKNEWIDLIMQTMQTKQTMKNMQNMNMQNMQSMQNMQNMRSL